MKLPDFALAPWEVPPGNSVPLIAPATEVFEGYWRGRKTEIWTREIATDFTSRIFFREAESQNEGNWNLRLYDLDLLKADHEIPIEGLHFDFVTRVFYWEGAPFGHPGCQELTIGPTFGRWSKFENWPVPRVIPKVVPDEFFDEGWFELDLWSNEEFRNLNAGEFEIKIRKYLADPCSAGREALNWLHFSDFERHCVSLQISATDLETVQTLMRYVLRIQGPFWKDAVAAAWRIRNPEVIHDSPMGRNQLLLQRDPHRMTRSTSVSHPNQALRGLSIEPLPPSLERWWPLLWNYFKPSYQRPSAFWDQSHASWHHDFDCIEVLVELPTGDEVVEAWLALRDWSESVGHPEEFAALKAELSRALPEGI